MSYGQELVIDLYECNSVSFNRRHIQTFLERSCVILGVHSEELHFWDYDTPEKKAAAPPHLKGTSAVQFLSTSNITIHCLDDLGLVCINFFTCGIFKPDSVRKVCEYAVTHFNAKSIRRHTILERG